MHSTSRNFCPCPFACRTMNEWDLDQMATMAYLVRHAPPKWGINPTGDGEPRDKVDRFLALHRLLLHLWGLLYTRVSGDVLVQWLVMDKTERQQVLAHVQTLPLTYGNYVVPLQRQTGNMQGTSDQGLLGVAGEAELIELHANRACLVGEGSFMEGVRRIVEAGHKGLVVTLSEPC